MKKIKMQIVKASFLIGVNVIGLPEWHCFDAKRYIWNYVEFKGIVK